jgi:hypothetical protein
MSGPDCPYFSVGSQYLKIFRRTRMMKLKLLPALLSVVTLCVASSKTYDVSFSSPTKLGSLELKAGKYSLKVDGNKAVFTSITNLKKPQSFTVEVKVENSPSTFEYTQVDASTEGSTSVVKDIELGGSKTKIDF